MSNAWIDAQERREGWPLRYVEGKEIPRSEAYPHHRIVVTAGLHKLAGNERPYWSVTAEIINKRKRGDNATEGAGAMHKEIARHFPALAPVIALHLADDRGVPMHAVANARYWLGLTEFKSYERGGRTISLPDVRTLARHLRISESDARAMVARYPSRVPNRRKVDPVTPPYDADAFRAEIESHRERWQAESDAAVALLLSMGAIDARDH